MAKAATENPNILEHHYNRLRVAFAVFTLVGIGVFIYFLTQIGIEEILDDITKFGFYSFGLVLLMYFGRILVRSLAWKLSVAMPYKLRFIDTLRAVLIGESLSS